MAPPRLKKSRSSAASHTNQQNVIQLKIDRIQSLESSLSGPSPSSLNPLADLLLVLTSSVEPEVTFKALYAAGRVLASLHESGRFSLGGQDEKEKVVVSWLRGRLDEFVAFCGGLLKDQEKDLRVRPIEND